MKVALHVMVEWRNDVCHRLNHCSCVRLVQELGSWSIIIVVSFIFSSVLSRSSGKEILSHSSLLGGGGSFGIMHFLVVVFSN